MEEKRVIYLGYTPVLVRCYFKRCSFDIASSTCSREIHSPRFQPVYRIQVINLVGYSLVFPASAYRLFFFCSATECVVGGGRGGAESEGAIPYEIIWTR